MAYNLYIKTQSKYYNILNIEKDDLQIVIDAFNYGKDDFFIRGKKYWLANLFEIRIFNFQNSRIDDFIRMIETNGLDRKSFGSLYIPPESLERGGEDVTKEFIKGAFGFLLNSKKNPLNQNLSDIDIFISHSSSDIKITTLLIEIVRKAFNISSERIRCTSVPGYKLKAGANTDDQIKQEIFSSKAFIGVLTRESFNSTYVLFELGARWGANLPLIPLICDKVGTVLLNGPIKNINALSPVDSSDMLQFLHDLGDTLGLEPEKPAGYISDIEKLNKLIIGKEIIQEKVISLETDEYAEAEKIIKIQSEIQWPDDYEMRLHYIKTQQQALHNLKRDKPEDLTEQEFQRIRIRAKNDWPQDFEMRFHTEETQIESLRQLKKL
jgi:hypothetical protein